MPEKAIIARRPFLSSANSRRERSAPLPRPSGSNPKSPGLRPEPYFCYCARQSRSKSVSSFAQKSVSFESWPRYYTLLPHSKVSVSSVAPKAVSWALLPNSKVCVLALLLHKLIVLETFFFRMCTRSIWTTAAVPKISRKESHTSICPIVPSATAASWSLVSFRSPEYTVSAPGNLKTSCKTKK
jgi:hypothetical protein